MEPSWEDLAKEVWLRIRRYKEELRGNRFRLVEPSGTWAWDGMTRVLFVRLPAAESDMKLPWSVRAGWRDVDGAILEHPAVIGGCLPKLHDLLAAASQRETADVQAMKDGLASLDGRASLDERRG